MDAPTILRIEFDDSGQDFTHWDVDAKTGLIVDCQPFQYSFWCDGKRHVRHPTNIRPGSKLHTTDSADLAQADVWSGVLKHAVARVREVPADWLHIQNIEKAARA